jgi:arylsulfatase A-like enzyme
MYTSDQGFFLGDHGWFDKRFMYEESLRMPFIVRYPREIAENSVCDKISLNLDFAKTILDFAGIDAPDDMQGASLRPLMQGETPEGWRTSFYYRYWMHLTHHNVPAHIGLRTERYKLIFYYG